MRPQATRYRRGWNFTGAFTLVELLVVIAIIAILAAMLLPVLSQAKSEALNAACMDNERQLQICLELYVTDHNDNFVPNNSVAVIDDPGADISGMSWLPDTDADTEISPTNIINGLLFPYNRSLAIYHCPADTSTLETSTGKLLPQLRWRSYNMSQSINGDPQADPEYYPLIPAWTKYTAVRHPTLGNLFVFIDENAETIEDADFGNPPVGSPYFEQNVWWDMPSSRHIQGANLSFADGHVEHWHWKVPKKFIEWVQPVPPVEMPDYSRIQNVMKQPYDD